MDPVTDFFDRASQLLVDPSNRNFSRNEQKIAWAVTILTGILTVGAVQLASGGWRFYRDVKDNDTQKMISNLVLERLIVKKEVSGDSINNFQKKIKEVKELNKIVGNTTYNITFVEDPKYGNHQLLLKKTLGEQKSEISCFLSPTVLDLIFSDPIYVLEREILTIGIEELSKKP